MLFFVGLIVEYVDDGCAVFVGVFCVVVTADGNGFGVKTVVDDVVD